MCLVHPQRRIRKMQQIPSKHKQILTMLIPKLCFYMNPPTGSLGKHDGRREDNKV